MKRFLLVLTLLAATVPSTRAMDAVQEVQQQTDSLWSRTKELAKGLVNITKKAAARVQRVCDAIDRKLDQANERTKKRHAHYWRLLRTSPLRFLQEYLKDTIHDFNQVVDAAIIVAPFALWYIQTYHPELLLALPQAVQLSEPGIPAAAAASQSYGELVGALGVPQPYLNAAFDPHIHDFRLG